MNRTIATWMLLAVWGCERQPDATKPPVSSAASSVQMVEVPSATPAASAALPTLDFAMAKPTTTQTALPARFSAALPTTYEERHQRPLAYPPEPYVTARLCAGDEGMQLRVLTAWRAAVKKSAKNSATGASTTARPTTYGDDCEAACAWAVTIAEDAKEPQGVRQAAAEQLRPCHEPRERVLRVMGSDVAPAETVRSWLMWTASEGAPVGYLPSMPRVLKEGAKSPNATFGQRLAAVAVGTEDDPKIAAALLDHHARTTDPELKRAVAYGMHAQSDERAKKVFLMACRSAKEPDPLCPAAGRPPRQSDLAAKVRAYQFDVEGYLRRHPERKAAVGQTLEACIARDPTGQDATDDHNVAWCIETLARIDWAAARKHATKATPGVRESLGGTADALDRFDSSDAMVKHLADRGWALKIPKTARTPTNIREALQIGGRATRFDTETGSFPNNHDELMFRLARLAGDDLKGVVFEEIPPDESEMDSGGYELRAYADGQRYVVPAENHGDWYDVDAVLGLLNALLVAKKSSWRYAVVPTGGQDIIVVTAPEKTLATTARDGLLSLAEASDAMEKGKAFERKVLDDLRGP